MAAFVLTDAFVSIGGNVLSTYVTEVESNFTATEQQTTAMGATWESFIAGLKSGTVKLKFNQDVAAGLLDAIIWPLFGTVPLFEIRNTSAVAGTSNPKWTGSLLLNDWTPLSGQVGTLATVSPTWKTSGVVTRATA